MRKLALSFVTLVMALAVPITRADAQVMCSPNMDYIIYWYDGPPPTGPLVGVEVFWCDGSSQLLGSYGTHDASQDCICAN